MGYSNPSKATNDHCKHAFLRRGNDSLGREQEFKLVPEGDVYRLIARSNLPKAVEFESWVFDEVIPTIRKNGIYVSDQMKFDPDYMIQIFTEMKNKQARIEALEEKNAVLEMQNAELQPKASYVDVVLQCKDAISISVIASDYGVSAKKMNQYLHDFGIQYKQGKIWILYQKYLSNGYTCTKTHPVDGKDGEKHSYIHTYWTQKGRLFLYQMLKEKGILPLMEQELEEDEDNGEE